MESANIRRSRLTSELQQAYREWLRATDDQILKDGADASGGNRKAKWVAYLAAKSRLVAANAERPAA